MQKPQTERQRTEALLAHLLAKSRAEEEAEALRRFSLSRSLGKMRARLADVIPPLPLPALRASFCVPRLLPAMGMIEIPAWRPAFRSRFAEMGKRLRSWQRPFAVAAATANAGRANRRPMWEVEPADRVDEARSHAIVCHFTERHVERRPAGVAAEQAEWPVPPPAQFPKIDKAGRRSDFVIGGLGVALGVVCALFPWYIFFNQDQFGVQAIKLGGRGNNAGRIVVESRPGSDFAPPGVREMSKNLDLFTTGNVPDKKQESVPDDQPFPGDALAFKLVHIANGRAMVQDDTGLWIVQAGSKLPDSSRVTAIEQRGGKWVLVTSTNKVMEVSN